MRHLRNPPCNTCGKPHWFRYWVDEFCARAKDGLSVGDFDMPFHRFKRVSDKLGDRSIEHFMVVEVKIADERLGPAQQDSLSVFNGMLQSLVPVNGAPIGVRARPGFIKKGEKKIVWHGVHLLRVPAMRRNIGPFYWDNKYVGSDLLRGILNFDRDPNPPHGVLDIDRRHKAKQRQASLFSAGVLCA